MLEPDMPTLTTARDELRRLLLEAQRRDGRSWERIGVLADVPGPTIRGWVGANATVKDFPILGYLRVARVLRISLDEIARVSTESDLRASGEELLREVEDALDTPEGNSETESDDPRAE